MRTIVGVFLVTCIGLGATLVGACSSGGSGGGKTYYVNAAEGDDLATGRKKAEAWQTIDRVNAADLQPGDEVRFKTGQVWREQLVVPASGTMGPTCSSPFPTGFPGHPGYVATRPTTRRAPLLPPSSYPTNASVGVECTLVLRWPWLLLAPTAIYARSRSRSMESRKIYHRAFERSSP